MKLALAICHARFLDLASFEEVLAAHGYRVTYLPVDRDGLLKLADLENAVTDQTAVVSLMWANNETGVLLPVKEVARICRGQGVLYHYLKQPDVRKLPAKGEGGAD